MSKKPEGMPEEIWEMALRFWRDSGCSTGTAEPFARAIMAAITAEREACAVLAANRWQLWGHEKRGQPFKVDLASCNDIAAAILNRREA